MKKNNLLNIPSSPDRTRGLQVNRDSPGQGEWENDQVLSIAYKVLSNEY